MTLYVVTLPDPPAGEDFLFTVPGRYLYDVTGITAELDTGGPTPTIAADASGNGHDGTYHAVGGAQIVPGILPAGGDGALDCSGGTLGATARAHVTLPAAMIDWSQPWTVEAWVQSTTGVGDIVLSMDTFTGNLVQVQVSAGPPGLQQIKVQAGNGGVTWDFTPTLIADGAPHYVVATWDTANVHAFLDGTELVLVTPGDPIPVFVPDSNTLASANGTNNGNLATLDEVAIYDVLLPDIVIGAHYAAASVSFAAYTAAVLGDAPFSYYHMDDTSGGGRQPSLIVTNGTTELEAIPTGFPAVSTPGPYEYSWQPGLNADTQSTDGTLTTVAIPRLLLPAGYTVGPRTLDLAPTDQWSNVALWWDSRIQDKTVGLAPYDYPPGALLRRNIVRAG